MSDVKAEVVMYTTPWCPYCTAAKRLFSAKGVSFKDVDVSGDQAMRAKLVEMSGGRTTVPQIFINGAPIGGFDDINALERGKKLDALLAVAPA
ncbi:glutaredoxin 3 [Acanthopleuribacter pedis]|uniref:Glutaredoxin n=1 Tax=Acanthopleuribacter pedis TaxID=442870 RepID=A0A8J7QSV5_9BACT|nr:glutaredoxin 3 [Acanthopleuribacter pedis]MBO1323138.1 glutaredoxin 3 [Acanthopleuribacter pedis]